MNDQEIYDKFTKIDEKLDSIISSQNNINSLVVRHDEFIINFKSDYKEFKCKIEKKEDKEDDNKDHSKWYAMDWVKIIGTGLITGGAFKIIGLFIK